MSSQITPRTQIRKLPYKTFSELVKYLDVQTNKNWEALINVLPENMYSQNEVLLFKNLPLQGKSPASALLTDLAQQLMTVRELINYLEKIEHQEALLLLKPHKPVTIVKQPQSISVQAGNRAVLECKGEGFPRPEYYWIKDGIELESEIGSAIVFESVTEANAGEYQCRILNSIGSEYTNTVTLQVMPRHQEIRITKQPHSSVVTQGEPFRLECGIHGDSNAEYQWFRDGWPIDGANSSELDFPSIRQRDEGNYSCRITLPYGDITRDIMTDMANIKIRTPVELPAPREYASNKVALLIGNEKYAHSSDDEQRLRHPEDDVFTLQQVLLGMGFKVMTLINLKLDELESAINRFCEILDASPGTYAFFYFGGHGFEVNGKTYLVPCDAPTEWTPKCSVCTEYILYNMQHSKTKLDALVLDVCRVSLGPNAFIPSKMFDPPFKSGCQTIISYATCPQARAYEKKRDSNGIYVKHLKKYLSQDLRIQDVIERTNADVRAETECHQATNSMHPTFKSSLTKDLSLLDPTSDDDRDASLMWMEYLKMPSRETMMFDDDIIVEAYFHELYMNAAYLVLHVADIGRSNVCDAQIYKAPEGVEMPERTMNQKKSVSQDSLIARGNVFSDAERHGVPNGFERWSRVDCLQRMPNLINVTIEVDYLIDGERKQSHKSVVFKRDNFGVVQLCM